MALPLAGKRVLVTRARAQSEELASRLRALGADPVLLPGIEVQFVAPGDALGGALTARPPFDWIVFTSQNAVPPFVAALQALPPGTPPRVNAGIAVVGKKTRNSMAALVARRWIVPGVHTAEALAEHLAPLVKGRRVLWPRGETANADFARRLKAAGAFEVREVVVYRTMAPDGDLMQAVRALRRGEIDVATFASPKTLWGVLERLGEDATKLLSRCRLAVIGPSTAEAVRKAGLAEPTIAEPHTVEGLVEAVVRALK